MAYRGTGIMSVALTEKEIKAYIDSCIEYWRDQRRNGDDKAVYYIDAYQSMRISLFDKLLGEKGAEHRA
jgi:hypothetical protein